MKLRERLISLILFRMKIFCTADRPDIFISRPKVCYCQQYTFAREGLINIKQHMKRFARFCAFFNNFKNMKNTHGGSYF